jgi:hypothetical protein
MEHKQNTPELRITSSSLEEGWGGSVILLSAFTD